MQKWQLTATFGNFRQLEIPKLPQVASFQVAKSCRKLLLVATFAHCLNNYYLVIILYLIIKNNIFIWYYLIGWYFILLSNLQMREKQL